MKSKTRNIIFAAIALVVVIGVIAGAMYLTEVGRYRKSIASISVSDVEIISVPDGSYEGDCDVGFIYAKVGVTVKNGAITGLKLLEHKNDRGAPAEKLVSDILNKQTLDVDAVTARDAPHGCWQGSVLILQAGCI